MMLGVGLGHCISFGEEIAWDALVSLQGSFYSKNQ